MLNRFCVTLTHCHDDPDRATVAFVLASAALASDQETMVFLTIEGVRLALQGEADKIHEEGFAPLKTLMEHYLAAGGKVYVCSPCFKKRGLAESDIREGVQIVGGAKLVEFMRAGAASISL